MKMSTRDSLICLFTGLALCALPACGPSDPSEENNKTSDNKGIEQDMSGGGGGTTDMGGTGTTDMNGGGTDMNGGGGTDMNGGGGTDMNGGTGDMGEPLGECAQRALYEGQMGNMNPARGGGGSFAVGDGAYADDSGLAAVAAAVKAAIESGSLKEDDEATADVREDELLLEDGSELVVTGAIITATAYERADDNNQFSYARSLFFQDKQAALNMFLPSASDFLSQIQTDKDGNPIVLKVGDKVNFKVKMLKVYSGNPQIGAIIDVEKVGENEDVGVAEMSGVAIPIEDFGKMVRVHGTVTAENGGCGGDSLCFNLEHGDQTNIFRISMKSLSIPKTGDCITFVGPLNAFGGNPQFDAVNFAWYRGPFGE